MSKRWGLRLLLAVMLLAAFSAAASADEGDGWYDASQEEYFWQDQQEVVFPDVTPEHWSYDDVMYLYRNGIIGGFPDGTFRPEEKVTTGQALKMIILAAGYAEPETVSSHWARGYLNFALEAGILERGEKLPSLETLLTLLNQLNVSADMVLCDVLNTGYAIKGSQLSEQLAGCDKKVQDRVLAVVATLLRNP